MIKKSPNPTDKHVGARVEAIEVVTATAADLARFTYGDSYLQALAQKVMQRAGQPIPETAP